MNTIVANLPTNDGAGRPSASGDDGLAMLERVRLVTAADIAPNVIAIDVDGVYPEDGFRHLGAAGAFRPHAAGLPGVGMARLDLAIEAMAAVGEACLTTAFCMWCQDALVWYLANTPNTALSERLLGPVADGTTLGGTGLSNPMKAFFGIEKMRLMGSRVAGGWRVSGTLPWVSNIGDDRLFGAIFETGDDRPRHVMVCVDCAADGVTVTQNAHFTALEGSRTFSVRLADAFIPDELVIADPAEPFIARVRAGFILLQCGMAFGLVDGCIQVMRQMDKSHAHVNRFLPDRPEMFEDALAALRSEVRGLCDTPLDTDNGYFRAVLEARLKGSELALRAAQAAMLHAGARGYLSHSPAQRRLRESYFVAIVTPATKQLLKMLDDLGG